MPSQSRWQHEAMNAGKSEKALSVRAGEVFANRDKALSRLPTANRLYRARRRSTQPTGSSPVSIKLSSSRRRRRAPGWGTVEFPGGTRVLYTSENRSLSVLEILVHLSASIPERYVLGAATIPDDVAVDVIADNDLPIPCASSTNAEPAYPLTQPVILLSSAASDAIASSKPGCAE
jgi:hypothetical protein